MPKLHPEKTNFLSEEFVHDDSEDSGDETSRAGQSKDVTPQESDLTSGSDIGLKSGISSKVGVSEDESEEGGENVSKGGDKESKSDGEDSITSKGSTKRSIAESGRGVNTQAKRQKTNSEGPIKFGSKEFSPPAGFNPLILGASDFATDSTEIFANLDGKQVWHITAPATLNIALIKDLDLEAAMRGDSILTENGINYSLQETSSEQATLMLATDTSARYQPSKTKLSKSFKLSVRSGSNSREPPIQTGEHQSPTTEASQFVAQSSGKKREPREQPEGLHMQYQPFGAETLKRRSIAAPLHVKGTPIRSKDSAPPAGSSGDRPRHALNTKASATPIENGVDVEMEDAPTPSKLPKKDPTNSTPILSKTTEKVKRVQSAAEDSTQAKATKKQKKSKLVDGAGL